MSIDLTARELLDPPQWAILERAARVYRTHVDPDFDIDGALQDVEAVRELLRLLGHQRALRRLVRDDGNPDQHELLDSNPDTAATASDSALEQMRRRQDSARREKRASRRGTAQERREARHMLELSKARGDRAAALELVKSQDATIAALRASVGELTEALTDQTSRTHAALAARDAVRAELATPTAAASALLTALDEHPLVLTEAAAAVLPDPAHSRWFTALLSEIASPTLVRQRRAQRALSLDMLGGGTEVGGSCALVSADDTRILIDAGTRPKADSALTSGPPRLDEALAGDLNAIVITHAHADHAGWVPAIIAARPDVPVYTSPATADLLPVMWDDAATIYRRERQGAVPFTAADVRAAVRNIRTVPFGRPFHIQDLSLSLFPAGHIAGAAGVHVSDGEHTLIVTGDISGPGQKTVGGYQLPADLNDVDLLVMESTYGAAQNHTPRERVTRDFIRDIGITVSGGGRVLVPAFALGRAQEIALLIADQLPHVPVLIDGLARDITELYEGMPGADGKPLSILSDRVQVVPKGQTSKTVGAFTSGVVITTSGMMNGGPAMRWSRAILPDPRSALMIVGYQDPNSPGGKLIEAAETKGEFTLPDTNGNPEIVEVNATVRSYGLGAHASSDELVQLATTVRAKATMLVHGDPGARAALARRLEDRHLTTVDAATPWRAAASA